MDTNKHITLLIADDEASIRNGLTTVVPWEQFGITIAGVAEDGMEAYHIIKECHPDIVITDIRMPNLDGLELMERVRMDKIQTNFIILSGYGDFQYAQKAIQLGAKNYFLKPVKIDELVAEIRRTKSELLQSDYVNSYSAYLNVKSEGKERFIKKLLKNEFNSYEEIHDNIRDVKLTLKDEPYRAMVFDISDRENLEASDEFYGMNCLMESVSGEMDDICHELFILGSYELLALIYKVKKNTALVDYSFLAEKCRSRVKRDFALELRIGIGSERKSLLECSDSYKTARMGMSYSFYETSMTVFDESVICQVPPPTSANHMDYNDLIYYITANHRNDIREFCGQYFNRLLYVPMPSPNYIRGMCIYLVMDVWKELGSRLGAGKEFAQTEIIFQINTVKTWEELKSYILDLLEDCAEKLAGSEGGSGNKVIQAAEYYIKSHMGEKILAKHVAGYVNLSDVYFTSYFKLKTGVNFRDYVIRMKMEQAKDVMGRMPDMPVAEVAASIGYDDYRSFYRIFKQYTGVNPSDYNKRG